jgi:hypothetical protein
MIEIRVAPFGMLDDDLVFAIEHAEPEGTVKIGNEDQILALRWDVP